MFAHTSDYVPNDEAKPRANVTTIRINDFDEYEVPDGSDTYYTDDREDAIATARVIHGADVKITFRRVRSD